VQLNKILNVNYFATWTLVLTLWRKYWTF
jgi:hypothetical protein